ncbi:MAG: hypothetical protein JJU11_07715 [Candidatus Sumerlaeia bacterium]|nr:hypothetical protein [Candidatus Sumerlaeia bacterium]
MSIDAPSLAGADSGYRQKVRPWVKIAAEILLIVSLAIAVSGLQMIYSFSTSYLLIQSGPFGSEKRHFLSALGKLFSGNFYTSTGWTMLIILALVPLFIRIARTRIVAITGMCAITVAGVVSGLAFECLLMNRPIASEIDGVPIGTIWIPFTAFAVRELLIIAVVLLVALASARGRKGFLKFAAVWIVGTFLLGILVYLPLRMMTVENDDGVRIPFGGFYWPGIIAGFAYACAVAWLPGQRAALARLREAPPALRNDERTSATASFPWANFGMAILGLVAGVGLLASILYTSFEATLIRSFFPPELHPVNPSLVDARGAMAARFTEGQSERFPDRLEALPLVGEEGETPKALVDELWTGGMEVITENHIEAVGLLMGAVADMVADFREAAQADYMRFATPKLPAKLDPHNIRDVSRLLQVEGYVKLHEGDIAGALDNARVIGRVGALISLDQSSTLQTVTLGMVSRSNALALLRAVYRETANDPEGRALLREMLAQHAHIFRFGIPFENLVRTEHAFWKVTLYPMHYTTPTINRVNSMILRTWTTYEQLLIAIALDEFHRDHGVYPTELGELVPNYLHHVRAAPSSGEPFYYDPKTPSPDAPFTLMIGEPGSKIAESIASPQAFRPTGEADE